MDTDKPSGAADTDPYNRCLAYIEDDLIVQAERQARRIENAAIRTIAQDQIRFVLQIKACLGDGNKERARRLARSLIGGIRLRYEAALGIDSPTHTPSPSSPRSGGEQPSADSKARHPPPNLASFPPDIRGTLKQLTQITGRARAGKRHLDLSPAVLLHLGWIARRAWRRGGKGLSPLRASASEIRITGACLRQRIEKRGQRLSIEDLSRETCLSRVCVATGVRNLRQFLL
jgi:hypothetical protein